MGKKVPHMSETHARLWFGDEIPRHQVEVEAFLMDAHEVTNTQFAAFVDATGHQAQGEWAKFARKGREQHPVVNVTWADARAYAEWAGKRLPTEAEWEYAALGGRDVKWFTWGDEPDPSKANYRHQGESMLAGLGRIMGLRKMGTRVVGSFDPNGYGLYDMLGNVAEWCSNERTPYPDAIEENWPYREYGSWGDDKPIAYGKAVRGGSWRTPNAVFFRITHRGGFRPEECHRWLGFRCVQSLKPDEKGRPDASSSMATVAGGGA
jgi:iron(II)-dependent oxidoreductase